MNLNKLLLKVYQLEGLVIALNKLIELEITVQSDCLDSFNGVCAIASTLKDKAREITNDISKRV